METASGFKVLGVAVAALIGAWLLTVAFGDQIATNSRPAPDPGRDISEDSITTPTEPQGSQESEPVDSIGERVFSSHRDFFSLSRGTAARERSPRREYLVLETQDEPAVPINLTGWRVQSITSGRDARIGRLTQPPYIHTFFGTSPVTATDEETFYLISGRSPVGMSFRANMCSGYLNQFGIQPAIRERCPDPIETMPYELKFGPSRLSDRCLDTINGLERCEAYLVVDDIPRASRLSQRCIDTILTDINHDGCIRRNISKEDFWSDDYYIYLGSRNQLWKDAWERIQLLDNQLRIVDEIEYQQP